MEDQEIWKDIEEYEGLYQVSNMGRVRSLDAFVNVRNGTRLRKGRILNFYNNIHGYYYVDLSKNSKVKHHTVHRLVASAFIPNPDNLPVINHRNELKTDNRVENLEWCTQKYNNEYSHIPEKGSKSTSKPCIQYTKDGIFVAEFKSTHDAQRKTGIHQGHISSCCLGRKSYKYVGGFIWKYKNGTE